MSLKPTYIKGDYKPSSAFNGKRIVFGCSGLGGVWRPIEEKIAVDTLIYAMEQGVDAFDVAPSYNKAEQYLGKALREFNGTKPFVSTKVGRLMADKADEFIMDYTPETMRRSVHNSLEKLGLDKIDLLFLHEPQLVPVDRFDEIIGCLHDLKAEGIIDKIGIGGNPTDSFYPFVKKEYFDVLSGFLKIDACNLSGFEKDIPLIQQESIAYYASSALHMGLLGRRLQQHSQERPNSEWVTNTDVDIALKVDQIAKQNDIPISNLALRYLFSMKEADRVVVGPTTLDQLKNLLEAWEEGKLEEDVFDAITSTVMNHKQESHEI